MFRRLCPVDRRRGNAVFLGIAGPTPPFSQYGTNLGSGDMRIEAGAAWQCCNADGCDPGFRPRRAFWANFAQNANVPDVRLQVLSGPRRRQVHKTAGHGLPEPRHRQAQAGYAYSETDKADSFCSDMDGCRLNSRCCEHPAGRKSRTLAAFRTIFARNAVSPVFVLDSPRQKKPDGYLTG